MIIEIQTIPTVTYTAEFCRRIVNISNTYPVRLERCGYKKKRIILWTYAERVGTSQPFSGSVKKKKINKRLGKDGQRFGCGKKPIAGLEIVFRSIASAICVADVVRTSNGRRSYVLIAEARNLCIYTRFLRVLWKYVPGSESVGRTEVR